MAYIRRLIILLASILRYNSNIIISLLLQHKSCSRAMCISSKVALLIFHIWQLLYFLIYINDRATNIFSFSNLYIDNLLKHCILCTLSTEFVWTLTCSIYLWGTRTTSKNASCWVFIPVLEYFQLYLQTFVLYLKWIY